ncbi:MAG: hypothetical protein U1F77_06975 [Kiritimatiellia bacterium]
MNTLIRILLAALVLIGPATRGAASPWKDLDPARVSALAGMLDAGPRGLGPPAPSRKSWEELGRNKAFAKVIRDAEKLVGKPLPDWDDKAYLDFSTTGRRGEGEKMLRACRGRLSPSSGPSAWRTRPVPPGSCILREYLREPTLTLPAHDRDLGSFKGTDYTIDLASSATAYELAQALWMLGSRLDGAVRAEVIAVLETRIFAPFRARCAGRSGTGG